MNLLPKSVVTLCADLLSVFFPWKCACGSLLPYPRVLCEPCTKALKRLESPICLKCGSPMPPHWRVKKCIQCQAKKSPITRLRSVFHYEGLPREMIHDLKYKGELRVSRFFSEELFICYSKNFSRCEIDSIVPVPLHRKREWKRHFNQAEELAKQFSALSGLKIWNGLKRPHITKPQSELSGLARRKNLGNAFTAIGRSPQHVLLIDDVTTTETTLRRCALVLRRAGARRVYALTVARAVKRLS